MDGKAMDESIQRKMNKPYGFHCAFILLRLQRMFRKYDFRKFFDVPLAVVGDTIGVTELKSESSYDFRYKLSVGLLCLSK